MLLFRRHVPLHDKFRQQSATIDSFRFDDQLLYVASCFPECQITTSGPRWVTCYQLITNDIMQCYVGTLLRYFRIRFEEQLNTFLTSLTDTWTIWCDIAITSSSLSKRHNTHITSIYLIQVRIRFGETITFSTWYIQYTSWYLSPYPVLRKHSHSSLRSLRYIWRAPTSLRLLPTSQSSKFSHHYWWSHTSSSQPSTTLSWTWTVQYYDIILPSYSLDTVPASDVIVLKFSSCRTWTTTWTTTTTSTLATTLYSCSPSFTIVVGLVIVLTNQLFVHVNQLCDSLYCALLYKLYNLCIYIFLRLQI